MNTLWTTETIIAEIRRILANTHGMDISQQPDSVSVRELGIDSMQVIDIIMDMEDVIGQKIKDFDMPHNPTLADVAVMVRRNILAGEHT